MRHSQALAAILTAFALPLSASADVLDFDITRNAMTTADSQGLGALQPVGSSGWISQNHGDIPGVLDVDYRSTRFDNAGTQWTSLSTAAAGYDELVHVAAGHPGWAPGGSFHNNTVVLIPLPGARLWLNSFSLGSRGGAEGVRQIVQVNDLPGGSVVGQSATFTVGANDQSNFFPVNRFSLTGFEITWLNLTSDPTPWVGIDNIDFTVRVVPEPGSLAMLALGLLVVAAAPRRRP